MKVSDRKLHFAPYVHQQRALARLLREGRFKNATEFLRKAIDHYLDRLGQPTLAEQARWMAEEIASEGDSRERADMQEDSMSTDETW